MNNSYIKICKPEESKKIKHDMIRNKCYRRFCAISKTIRTSEHIHSSNENSTLQNERNKR